MARAEYALGGADLGARGHSFTFAAAPENRGRNIIFTASMP
jgi:hypothetical protein